MWIVDEMNATWKRRGWGYRNAHSHVAYGGHECVASGLDRGVPDSFGAVPGTSVNVHDARGQLAGNVAGLGAGVFVFPVDPTMVVALARLAEILAWQGRECDWSEHIDPHGWLVLVIGFVMSFIVAYGAVRGFWRG